MKKMTRFLTIIFYLAVIMLSALACSDNLDVNRRYGFHLETMPVQKKIALNETAEIRCQIVREGYYSQTEFFIRMFQVDGKGELRLDNGTVLQPNDLYPLDRETFRLYYTSHCADQQTLTVYIVDSFGQTVEKSFSWQNDSEDSVKEDAENKSFKTYFDDYIRLSDIQRNLLAVCCPGLM